MIAVDWEGGALLADYRQAAANTRVVGALVAQLITTLGANYNLRMEDVHLIGHSLGAQISGYVGSTIPRIGRITGKIIQCVYMFSLYHYNEQTTFRSSQLRFEFK